MKRLAQFLGGGIGLFVLGVAALFSWIVVLTSALPPTDALVPAAAIASSATIGIVWLVRHVPWSTDPRTAATSQNLQQRLSSAFRRAYHGVPGDGPTWLQAASRRRIAVAVSAGTVAGSAIAGVGLAWLLSPNPSDSFEWWLMGWGTLGIVASVGVWLRIEIARPIASRGTAVHPQGCALPSQCA